MNVPATLALAETAVHVFAGVSYGLLYLRTTRATELASFSTLSVALALYCFAHSQLADAQQPAAMAFAVELQFVALSVCLVAFLRFARDLNQGDESLLPGRVWAGLGLVLALSGQLADPAAMSFAEPAARLTALGVGWSAGAGVLSGLALLRLGRRAGTRSDPMVAIMTCSVAVLAFLWDTLLGAQGSTGTALFGHATMVGSAGVNYVLLHRLVQTGDELMARTRALRKSYAELRLAQETLVHKEQLAAVGELSAVIAHEVRNPLAVLKNASSALGRPDLSAENAEALLGILDEETDRLNRLVNDLLAYAKPLEPQSAEVGVAELIDRALGLARSAGDLGDGVGLTLSLEGAPDTLWVDANLLERALANVIDNALDAMDGAGYLTISAHEAQLPNGSPGVRLAFADSGEGMDTLVRKRAVDPFFTTRPSGTGLGLAIVDRVIRAHGGAMTITSRQEQGTEVSLLLPSTAESAEPADAVSDPQVPPA